MTTTEMARLFEKLSDQFGRTYVRPDASDLVAFTLLHKLVPFTSTVIAGAEHDIIYLNVDIDELAAAASEEDIVTLEGCGVYLDKELESLYMYV